MIRLLILVISVWIIMAILGGIGEGVYLGQHEYSDTTTTEEEGVINTLTNWKFLTADTLWGKFTGLFTDMGFYISLFQLATFDFAFFTGSWGIFRWVFFFPLTIALVASIAATFRGVST